MKRKLAFEIKDRGFRIRVWYQGDKVDALVQVDRDGKLLRKFEFPAYKIWNLHAHFSDIVDGELQKNISGYQIAASDGMGGSAGFKVIKEKDEKR